LQNSLIIVCCWWWDLGKDSTCEWSFFTRSEKNPASHFYRIDIIRLVFVACDRLYHQKPGLARYLHQKRGENFWSRWKNEYFVRICL